MDELVLNYTFNGSPYKNRIIPIYANNISILNDNINNDPNNNLYKLDYLYIGCITSGQNLVLETINTSMLIITISSIHYIYLHKTSFKNNFTLWKIQCTKILNDNNIGYIYFWTLYFNDINLITMYLNLTFNLNQPYYINPSLLLNIDYN